MIRKFALATFIAGTLDLVVNFLFWGLWKRFPSLRICQAVASGFFGKASFDGGYATAAVGVVTQYVIILGMAAGYYLLTRISGWARRHWGVSAVGYGLCLYIVMNYVVVPLSAADRPYPWPIVWDVKLAFNLFCHIVLVALPFAIVFSRDEAGRPATPQ